jgi:hypothetical protein
MGGVPFADAGVKHSPAHMIFLGCPADAWVSAATGGGNDLQVNRLMSTGIGTALSMGLLQRLRPTPLIRLCRQYTIWSRYVEILPICRWL